MIPIARPIIGIEEREAVDRVLASGSLAQGPEVASFEQEFAKFVGERKCVAVNSGTSALLISLVSAGIRTGDEVIVPSFTFAATANSVALTGATPVFVDIDPSTYNISPEAIESAITKRTRAIQPVHLFGQTADMHRVMEIALRHNLLVFEDASQAHLSSFHGKPAGTWGDAATFSFYPTKNMTSGEGGMVSCRDEAIARTCRLLRNQGMENRYQNEIVGYNLRMTDIHAAIGREQLKKIANWTLKRQSNAKFFDENLRNVVVPHVMEGATHVYHQYTIRVPESDRNSFAEEMMKRGVGNGVYYPRPVHQLPAYGQKFDLPNTSKACEEVLSIPVHPGLSKEDLERIVVVVNQLAKAGA